MLQRLGVLVGAVWLLAVPVSAQQPPEMPAATVCGQSPRPAAEPPAASGPVVLYVAPCFESQGNASVIDFQTYLYYIQLKDKISSPSQGKWIAYDETIEKLVLEDFKRCLLYTSPSPRDS